MRGSTTIEFIISVGIFISAVIIVASEVTYTLPAQHENAVQQKIMNKAYQISEILMFTEGWPKNWDSLDSSQISFIGLTADEKYVLNKTKIDAINHKCSNNYRNISNLLTQNKKMSFFMNITSGGSQMLYCGPPVDSLFSNTYSLTRYAIVNDSIAKVKIGVKL